MSAWFKRGKPPAPKRPIVRSTTPLASGGSAPKVAIVILNFNGKHHLQGCFESLEALDYPRDRFEIVLVDNGSSDGSTGFVERNFPSVRQLINEDNVGFSAGCNQGAKAASDAAVLVFLNNDMRVEPSWLPELVAPLVEGRCQATTAKMLSWDGKLIDSAGGGMNFHGIGIQKGYRDVPGPQHDKPGPSLFACGGAMAVCAETFHDVGGFDEEFFAYYEDVDLGWRMWVLGHRIEYVPAAVCYHHHSSTSRRFPVETIRLLQVRNPVLACFKNYNDEHLRAVLPAQLALAMRRTFLASGLEDDEPFRIEGMEPRAPGVVGRIFERAKHTIQETVDVRRIAAADLIGFNDLLGNFDHWQQRRKRVQDRRQRPDEEIFELFGKPFWCIEQETGYRELHHGLMGFFGIDRMFEGKEQAGDDPQP